MRTMMVHQMAVSTHREEGETERCKAVSVCELRDCGGWVISRGGVVSIAYCALCSTAWTVVGRPALARIDAL